MNSNGTSPSEHDMMEQQPPVREAADYLQVLQAIWPLGFVGMFAGLVRGFKMISRESTTWDKLLSLVVAMVSGGTVAVVGILLLPLIFEGHFSEGVELGIAGILGGLGTKGFDLVVRKVFKLSIVDLHDEPEQRRKRPGPVHIDPE